MIGRVGPLLPEDVITGLSTHKELANEAIAVEADIRALQRSLSCADALLCLINVTCKEAIAMLSDCDVMTPEEARHRRNTARARLADQLLAMARVQMLHRHAAHKLAELALRLAALQAALDLSAR
jgi:hypothetical protein